MGDLRFQLILLSAMPGICNTKKVENQGRKAKKSKVNVEPLSRCRFVFQKIRMEGVVCRDVLLEEDAAASALLAAGSVFSCMCVCVFAVSCLKTASTSVLAQQPNLQVESEVRPGQCSSSCSHASIWCSHIFPTMESRLADLTWFFFRRLRIVRDMGGRRSGAW